MMVSTFEQAKCGQKLVFSIIIIFDKTEPISVRKRIVFFNNLSKFSIIPQIQSLIEFDNNNSKKHVIFIQLSCILYQHSLDFAL